LATGRLELGNAGEAAAASWYEENGYEVVARNWRCEIGEIDIVARRRGLVVVAEVKTRTSDRFGVPAEAVGRGKQARLRKLGARYLRESALSGVRLRYDVVSVLDGRLEVLEDAF
jgi:putative endonuclease